MAADSLASAVAQRKGSVGAQASGLHDDKTLKRGDVAVVAVVVVVGVEDKVGMWAQVAYWESVDGTSRVPCPVRRPLEVVYAWAWIRVGDDKTPDGWLDALVVQRQWWEQQQEPDYSQLGEGGLHSAA